MCLRSHDTEMTGMVTTVNLWNLDSPRKVTSGMSVREPPERFT